MVKSYKYLCNIVVKNYNRLIMKEESLKQQYRNLIQQLKDKAKQKGVKITNEFIAESLGYDRTHLSSLLGTRGNVTQNHIKDLILHFPNELGGKIQHEAQQPTREVEPPPPSNNQLAALIDANRMMAEAMLIDARSRENLTVSNRELSIKITAGDPTQNQKDVAAMRSVVLELLSEIGAGKRYKSPDEVKAVYRKGIADALQISGSKGTQTHSDKLHTGRRSS